VTTAIIGTGNIGSAVARQLVAGGEAVVVAARNAVHAEALAKQLGPRAGAASVEDAAAAAEVVVLAIWLSDMPLVISTLGSALDGKVVIDPSNPIGFDANGEIVRTLPADRSAGAIVAALLPPRAHYAKAFGTLSAVALMSNANRRPKRAALFYATDDDVAARTAERLIRVAGYEPLKVGGAAAAVRIEGPSSELSQYGASGDLLDLDQAREAIHTEVPS
jgi:8-hydroxy-5-deazaflavin:NADPH oxidoreductase